MGLLANNGTVTGSALYRGQELVGLPPKALNRVRGSKITMIFQEPMTSLDPLYTIGRQIAEPIVHHRGGTFKGARKRVLELLELVGIPEAQRRIDSYPHVAQPITCRRRIAPEIEAGDAAVASGRLQKTAQHLEGCRFAGAVRTEEAENFAARYVESDVVCGGKIAEPLRQPTCLYHGSAVF